MSLVKVWTEVDDGKCQSLPAKIVSTKGTVLTIRYLSATEKKDAKNRRIYQYEEETYEVTDDSITEYLNSDTELDFGFEEISSGNFVKCDSDDDSDSDEDYVPSSESDDDDEEDSEPDEDASFTGGGDSFSEEEGGDDD